MKKQLMTVTIYELVVERTLYFTVFSGVHMVEMILEDLSNVLLSVHICERQQEEMSIDNVILGQQDDVLDG